MKLQNDKNNYLYICTSCILSFTASPTVTEAIEQPISNKANIILILADDLGITGLNCYGGAFKTPNLDAMAKTGIRFENCFSAPLCAPSRAMIVTGKYNFRTKSSGNNARAVTPETETIISKVLKNAGYTTAVSGKWSQLTLLSTVEEANAWGFDEFMIWDPTGERYWKPSLIHNGKKLETTEKDYGPDILNDYVIDFVKRNKNRPFFVYYPLTLIHSPLAEIPEKKSGNGLLADNIAYMDKLVGKLLDSLDKLNLREKTLVIFTGDNGCGLGGTINGKKINGDKGSLLEGGSRVPLIVNWKGSTPEGKVLKDFVELTDFYATFADLAGIHFPNSITDSISFAPQIKGEKGNPRQWVFIQLRDEWYIRNERWKLYNNGNFFDMKDAPFREILVENLSNDAKNAKAELQSILNNLITTDNIKNNNEKGNKRQKKW
ncbi:MAG TPA: sulfatase-like hydrolase/transferase [Victivallales bacterium]|nr:sulfatase-like hydrolase/transferase [Victivallales bacterium]HPO90695.1 sulfatase-like hydrolase/transferase [Victivallales bacterium]HRR28328.1 sulfatase-like hydrolase/transferase [Victivallales bacterium]HRU01345.1 sulfatase-like hydrolase/transferase [Victivallales bacterium]